MKGDTRVTDRAPESAATALKPTRSAPLQVTPATRPVPGAVRARREQGKRICLVIPSMSAGGAQRAMSVLASHLVARGHDVALITLEAPDVPSFFPLPEQMATVRLDKLGGGGPSRLVRVGARLRALRRAIRRIDPDVVLSFMDTMNMTTLLALSGSGIPVVVSERTDPRKHRIGRGKSLLRRLLYPFADAIVVQTDAVRAALPRHLQPRVAVIPNPIPAASPHRARPAAPSSDGRFRIVALGRLDPVKRFDRLIEAFVPLTGRHLDWDLVIIGGGDEAARLQDLVRAMGASARVQLLGERTDIYPLLAAGHLFAFPSLYEGFPNALAEALSVGLPAIGVRGVNGVDLLIHDSGNGLLVDEPLTAEGLGAALARLMAAPTLRETYGARSLAISREFSPERTVDLWEALLVEMAARPS